MATFRNREYQKRATRQGIRSMLAQEFYRPLERPILCTPRVLERNRPRIVGVSPEQMKLDFSANRPLNDLFPEAYEY